jgi:hypothetical protein
MHSASGHRVRQPQSQIIENIISNVDPKRLQPFTVPPGYKVLQAAESRERKVFCIYRTGLYTEFLVDLREQLETVWGEVNPVVAFAVGEYEADGGSLSCGFLLEDDRVGCQ